MKSHLHVRGLKLSVNLGWRTIERQQEQDVLLDLHIIFPKPPKACTTDRLRDTVCYATLVNALKNQLSTQHFHLIEHLAYTIYKIVKAEIKMDTQVTLHLTKYPKIDNLTRGVTFSYGDDES